MDPGTAESLADQNLSYLYNRNSEMDIKCRLIYSGESSELLLHIKMRKDVYEMTDYYVFEEYVNSYSDKIGNTSDTVQILDYIIKRTRGGFNFRIKVNPNLQNKIYVLHFANRHNQKHYYYWVPLSNTRKSSILIYDSENLPVIRDWISNENPVNIVSTQKDSLLFAYHYQIDFEPADPPMMTESSGNASLSIDSLFSVEAGNSISLTNQGLYFIQSDTTSLHGLGIRVQNSYFPELAHINDLINSLRYFSTRSEWDKLNTAINKKDALDNYWLSIFRSSEMAKSVIRNYFDQVEEANSLFTNYKEGWKTDMGMVFIIMGPPDEVFRNQAKEEWIYQKTEDLPKMKFTFEKINNIFTDNHYVLIRNADYRNEWYRAVEMWRKGRYETLIR
jgi:GWxTD domain-containing protein